MTGKKEQTSVHLANHVDFSSVFKSGHVQFCPQLSTARSFLGGGGGGGFGESS